MTSKRAAKKAAKRVGVLMRPKDHGPGKRGAKPAESRFTDLSEYEEEKDKTFLEEIGKNAAKNAINENKALGIPVTFLEGDWVVRRMPDGGIVRVRQVKLNVKLASRKLKKGTVIHVGRTSH